MDFLVFGVVFYGIVACGTIVAVTLIAGALRADQRYLDEIEARSDRVTSEPAWVSRRVPRVRLVLPARNRVVNLGGPR